MEEIHRKPLVFPVQLILGEGLSELVFRASADNCFLNTLHIMDLAGIPGIHAGSIGSNIAGREESLAHLLGPSWSAEAVAAIAFQPDERPGWHSWFGTSIRRVHRMAKTRRVSPRSLALSLHCKAVWSLKPFCFDPFTRERLLEECPVCGNRFGFRRSLGVQFCDRCSKVDDEGFIRGAVDLRDFPQPIVEVDDDNGLRLVEDLIDPDPAVRSAARGSLPAEIRSFDESQLFELCVSFASALTSDPTSGKGSADGLKSVADYRRISPDSLARSGRALLGWPEAFYDLLEGVQVGWDQRPGNYGVRKTLGPLTDLGRSRNLDPDLRGILRARIESHLARAVAQPLILRRAQSDDSSLITLQSAKRRFRTSQPVLEAAQEDGISTFRAKTGRKSPVLISVSELSELLTRRSDCLTPLAVARRLGIPILALRHLAEAGLIAGGPVRCRSGTAIRYSKQSVNELLKRLDLKLDGAPPPGHASSLCAAAVRLGSPMMSPWVGLLKSILDGSLLVWKSKTKQPPAYSLFVDASAARESVKAVDCWVGDEPDPALAAPCAASMLGMYLTTLRSLMREGLLSKTLRLSEVQAFSRNYASTREVRDMVWEHSRCGRAALVKDQIDSRIMPYLLQVFGLRPASGSQAGRNFIWKRSEIERFLAEWPKFGGMLADH